MGRRAARTACTTTELPAVASTSALLMGAPPVSAPYSKQSVEIKLDVVVSRRLFYACATLQTVLQFASCVSTCSGIVVRCISGAWLMQSAPKLMLSNVG